MYVRCRPRPGSQAVLLIVVFGLLLAPWATARPYTVNPIAGEDQEPEIATDPSFRELKGGLLEGIPEFPAYPHATLIGSAERNRPDEQNRGYRIKWTTDDRPSLVMDWYAKTLPSYGWKCVPADEPDEEDELEVKIANPWFSGYIEAESEDFPNRNVTQIVVVLARK